MILAIDTATRFISLALATEHAVIAESTWQSANNHTIELAPVVERMLGSNPLSAIAVAIGPGSFTGVRIGLGFAKGLALARQAPLFGARTFQIAARALPLSENEAIAVVQAGRGRVIWSRCLADTGRWEATDDGVVGTWEEVATAAEKAVVVGEIDSVGYEVLLRNHVKCASLPQNVRRAAYLAEIGWENLKRGETGLAALLMPVYAHQPVSGTA